MIDSDSARTIEQLRGELADAERHIAEQAERIRELEAEVERLQGYEGRKLTRAEVSAMLKQYDEELAASRVGHHALSPTRAEEQEQMDEILRQQRREAERRWPNRIAKEANETDAMASLANTLAGIDNEERD